MTTNVDPKFLEDLTEALEQLSEVERALSRELGAYGARIESLEDAAEKTREILTDSRHALAPRVRVLEDKLRSSDVRIAELDQNKLSIDLERRKETHDLVKVEVSRAEASKERHRAIRAIALAAPGVVALVLKLAEWLGWR